MKVLNARTTTSSNVETGGNAATTTNCAHSLVASRLCQTAEWIFGRTISIMFDSINQSITLLNNDHGSNDNREFCLTNDLVVDAIKACADVFRL